MELSLQSIPISFQTLCVAFLISSIPCIIAYAIAYRRRKERQSRHPFPFLSLPPELREIVYEALADQEITYPAQPALPSQSSTFSKFNWIFQRPSFPSKSTWLMLANRQVFHEFQSVLCKRGKFTFYVDQHNYKDSDLWTINRATVKDIKKCDIHFITTSNMLGAVDPRFMPREWPLRDRICQKLKTFQKLETASLHIKAIGNPLWNPLWIWFHASQAFKTAPIPAFDSIKFSLDSWSPGENQLIKSDDGKWVWQCPQGHFISEDPGRAQQIREFCASLYQECETCGGDGS